MSAESREHLRRRQDSDRRDLLVLVHRHLLEEGLGETASALRSELPWVDLEGTRVCDNVDLSLVLMEFQNFYQMRFNRRARLTKPSDEVRPPASSVGSAKRGGGGGRSRKAKSHDEDSNNVPKENMLVCNNSTGSGGGSSSDEGVAEVHSSSSNSGRCREISIPKSLLANADLKDLAFQMAREFAPPTSQGVSFSDVVGHLDVKRALEEAALLPAKHPELHERCGLGRGGGSRTTCLLLCGPPGTGKTMLARAVASTLGRPFLDLRPSSLASKWRGDSERLVRSAFSLARHNAPSVVFLDEAEALLGGGRDREGGTATAATTEHEASRRCKSEFLVQLDGAASNSSEDVLFLAATNAPSSLDAAVLRRFHRVFQVGLPTSEERCEMLRKNLSDLPLEKKEASLSALSADGVTGGYSGADLARGCLEARRMLFRRMVEEKEAHKNGSNDIKKKKPEEIKLSGEDLKEALERVKPLWLKRK